MDIQKRDDVKPIEMLPGLTRRTLVFGEKMMICEFDFDSNVTIPIHTHPHEQVGYVVRGKVRMTIGDQSYELATGDSYCAPSNIPHGAYTYEPTVIIDTFNPPREDYKK